MTLRIGTVCYACDQGLAHLAKWFYDAGVITDVMVFRHPHRRSPRLREWYPPDTHELVRRPFTLNDKRVDEFLGKVDAVLFFETPFDWSFVDLCRRCGVKTVMMPMYEWWPVNAPAKFDLFLCPSLLDLDYFPADKGYNSVFLPVPADPSRWGARYTALNFVHNAGHVGSRNHKGTEEVMAALRYVRSPINMTIRCQDAHSMARLMLSVPEAAKDGRVRFEVGGTPYDKLFSTGDVYVAPEKYNGLSLPLQEACQAGMLVMASNRFPANTWLPEEPLIPWSRQHLVRVGPQYNEITESIITPQAVAQKIDEWYGKDILAFSNMGREWAKANSWEVLKPKYLEVVGNLVN